MGLKRPFQRDLGLWEFVINILHLTDLHLFSNRTENLLGLDTTSSFEAVIKEVKANPFKPEVVLITGDLIQDKNPGTYKILSKRLNELFTVPIYWLPGNHDVDALEQGGFTGGSIRPDKTFVGGGWRVILLNSRVPGAVEGRLGSDQLAFLESTLSENPNQHTLVTFHHHPITTNSRWLDGSRLQNPEALFEITDRYPNVKAILWGHIHQEVDTIRNGVHLMCTPSTSIQFKPQTQDFALDTEAPGFRTLILKPDGTHETNVFRVPHFEVKLDYKSGGY